jgi:hypothetical protein
MSFFYQNTAENESAHLMSPISPINLLIPYLFKVAFEPTSRFPLQGEFGWKFRRPQPDIQGDQLNQVASPEGQPSKANDHKNDSYAKEVT